ncbi:MULTISPECIES: DnaJ domain-containing protein [Haloferax]
MTNEIEKFQTDPSAENYYDRLGVPQDADTQTIRKAGKLACKRTHPDSGGRFSGCKEFTRITAARDALEDDDERGHYEVFRARYGAAKGTTMYEQWVQRGQPQTPETWTVSESEPTDGCQDTTTASAPRSVGTAQGVTVPDTEPVTAPYGYVTRPCPECGSECEASQIGRTPIDWVPSGEFDAYEEYLCLVCRLVFIAHVKSDSTVEMTLHSGPYEEPRPGGVVRRVTSLGREFLARLLNLNVRPVHGLTTACLICVNDSRAARPRRLQAIRMRVRDRFRNHIRCFVLVSSISTHQSRVQTLPSVR